MVFPVAVLLLCSLALSSCVKDEGAHSWQNDREAVQSSIDSIKAAQSKAETSAQMDAIRFNKRLSDLETVNRAQQAQIDALTARIEKLHRKRKVIAAKKPAPKGKSEVKHRTTPVKAPVAPPVVRKTSPVVDRAALAEAEKNAYTAAYLALKSGRFEEASKGFNAQLDSYPKGEYADQAWYWLGESRLAQQSTDHALHAFKYVADHYPESVKHAAALLKLGQLSEMSGDEAAAVNYYNRLLKEHAEGTLAEQAREALADLQKGSQQ